MREIKFRAWDTVDKMMRIVSSINWFDECVEMDEHPNGKYALRNISEVVLMQYTGLKDKNGKEIYEGDILADADEPEACIHQVFWDNDKLSFNILTLADDEGNWDTGLYDDLGDGQVDGKTKFFEVIGNIYENPKLLTDK